MDNEASPLANAPQQSAIYAGYLSEYQTLVISSSMYTTVTLFAWF